jgi:hypothetical protein
VAGERLVDRVVDHLVHHVMEARPVVGVADIHARPLAHGIEALEDLDGLRAIAVLGGEIDRGLGHSGFLRDAVGRGRPDDDSGLSII